MVIDCWDTIWILLGGREACMIIVGRYSLMVGSECGSLLAGIGSSLIVTERCLPLLTWAVRSLIAGLEALLWFRAWLG